MSRRCAAKIEPMELVQQTLAFDRPDWLFEIEHDGFRALAYIDDGVCKFISRNDCDYQRFAELMAKLQGLSPTKAVPRDVARTTAEEMRSDEVAPSLE